MTPGEQSDLTYQHFVILRSAALAKIHGLEDFQARILAASPPTLAADVVTMVASAIRDAQNELDQLLYRWSQSKRYRSE